MTYLAIVLLLACSSALGQVTIKNPDHLPVPEQEVQVLLNATCQVVAQEFHVSRRDVDFPIVLVLGDPNEHFSSDEEQQLYSVYLYCWNEAQFALSAIRLAIQHMVTQTRRDRMVMEILKRSSRINTISIKALQNR
jgi:hypothetical protein